MSKNLEFELAEYVVYIPMNYNNGRIIEPEKINKTVKEISSKFGACTRQKESVGTWHSHNTTYVDQINKIEILTYDCEENDNWFKQEEVLIKKIKKIERL